MNEPSTQTPFSSTADRPPRRRWLRWVTVLVALLIALGLGGLAYLGYRYDEELRQAIEETDRRDPNWRLEQIEANRKTLRDEENSALQVLAVKQALPVVWPTPPALGNGGPTPPQLGDRINGLPPPVQLDEALTAELRQELEAVPQAVAEAQKLIGLREGRYPVTWLPNPMLTILSSQHARTAADLLRLQALLQAQDGQLDAALASARALINTAASIGDEPTMISQLVRFAVRAVAVQTVERILAQGQPSLAALEATQQRFADEAAQPLLYYALRGERAYSFQVLEEMKAGSGFSSKGGNLKQLLEDTSARLQARRAQPKLLRVMNECVEATKQPTPVQRERLAEIEQRFQGNSRDLQDPLVALTMPAVAKVHMAFHRNQAQMRCAVVGLALERYRQAHDRWPESLDQLVPTYLTEVPPDPFDDRPLRYRRLADGVLVYSIGPDMQDNGGAINRKNPTAPDSDLAFRLWNVKDRRQPAAELLSDPDGR